MRLKTPAAPQGETKEETLRNIKEAIKGYLGVSRSFQDKALKRKG
jgi:predicted RNase H-like HicB family nuclease